MHKPISPILSKMALVGILVFVGLKSVEAQEKASTLPDEPIVTYFPEDAKTGERIAHRDEISAIDQVRKKLHAQHHPHDMIKTRSIPSDFNPSAMASVADFALKKKLWSSSKSDRANLCTLWKANKRACVQSCDMAVGIPPEPLQHIFDFGFVQTGNRTKVAFGLVTDFPIIQQHLGEIQIESPVGKGTEVTISLSLGEPL